ncbi:MAG: septal ring lytic transglycosylase RlpA family protein [Burkholderiaceae bacterium]
MTNTSMHGAGRALGLVTIALALAACAGPQGGRSTRAPSADSAGASAPPAAAAPRRGGYYLDDGPGANPPVDLASIPDAVPRPEPLLPRTMRPYSVFGRQYTPMSQLEPYRERGMASWYGRRYHGQPTSSGEPYDMYAMTAAHPTLPIPSYARVTNVANGRSVVVRVNDRGPFLQNRVIDLSYTAAAKLGYVEAGSAEVEVDLITQFDGAAKTLASADAAPRGATAAPAAAPSVPALAMALVPAPSANAAPVTQPAPTPAAQPAATPAAMPAATPSTTTATAKAEPVRLDVETDYAAGGAPRASAAPATTADATASPRSAQTVAAVPALASASAPARAEAPGGPVAPTAATTRRGFWLQFGAFSSLENARSAMTHLARRLDFLGAAFDIRQEGALYKVQAGPWSRREDAAAAAGRVRARTDLRPFATLR